MTAVDPGWLDTIGLAGASRAEIEAFALAARPGLRWFEHPTSLVRMRVPERSRKPAVVFLPDGPASIESYDACAPHARTVEVDRAGHFVDLEAIAVVREELDRLTS